MNPLGNLRPSVRTPGPAARVSAAGGPGLAAAAAGDLRRSETSFFARVKRWFGMGSDQPEATRPLLDSLRPPSTGRLSFFFGRLSRLSGSQLALALAAHQRLREPAAMAPPRAAGPAPIPAPLLRDIQGLAGKKPDEIFDQVCQLWRASGAGAVEDLQQAALSFLRHGITHEASLVALRAALRDAAPRQSDAQVDARAQAIFAALVGSVQGHADAQAARAVHPLEGLDATRRAIERDDPPRPLLERVRGLAGVQVALDGLRAEHARDDRFGRLASACQVLQSTLQAHVATAMKDRQDAFMALPLAAARDQADAARAELRGLREAVDTFRDWPGGGRSACHALAARLGEALDDVARSQAVLERYDAIERPDARVPGAAHRPCAPLAQHLRSGTAAAYCALQSGVERICAFADPADQGDLLAALGEGVVSGKDKDTGRDKVSPALVTALLDGQPHAVDTILRADPWHDVARSLRLAGVAAREQQALAAAVDEPARADAIVTGARERFAVEILQQLRLLNAEVDRLLASRDPQAAGPRVGRTGAMTGANEAAILEVRKAGAGVSRASDVLLAHWIYCSCLDPRTFAIDTHKASGLWKKLKGDAAQLPGMDDVRRFMEQGFRSFDSIGDVHKRIKAFSRLVADAVVLGKASHGHDPRVLAKGLACDLHERLTGVKGVDPADPAFTRLLKSRVEVARQAWIDANPLAAAQVGAFRKREQLLAALQADRWHIALGPEAPSEATANPTGLSRAQLEQVVQCLAVAEQHVELAARTSGDPATAREAVNRFHAERFMPLARQLTRFDPVFRQSRGQDGAEPTISQMQQLLPYKGTLEALLNADRSLASLRSAPAQPGTSAATDDLEEVTEGAARIALLQQAIARGESPATGAQSTPADDLLARLDALGIRVSDAVPVIAGTAREAFREVNDRQVDLGIDALCNDLDPQQPLARGVVRPRVVGSPVYAPGVLGLIQRAQVHLKAPEARRQRDNLNAVVQRFSALEAGQSFDIHVGRRGDIRVGYTVVPGASVSAGVVAGLSNGIRISRRDETTYLLDVVATKSAGLTGGLSVLAGALTGSAQHHAHRATGYRITCTTPQQAIELMEAVVGLRQLPTGGWSSGQVTELEVQGQETRAAIDARVELDSPAGDALFKLEARMDKSGGTSLEVTQSPFLRTERRTHTRAWHASAGVDILDGRFQADAGRGAQVSVTRSCIRTHDGRVRSPALAVQVQAVGGDVRGALRRAMPHLADDEVDHFVAQVEEAQAASGGEGLSVAVELQCAMTQAGLDKANAHYGLARDWLEAQRRDGQNRTADAAMALNEADRAMRDPSHYRIAGVGLVLQSSVEADDGSAGLTRDTARVGSEHRQALSPPRSGGGVGQALSIHPAYQGLLAAAPA